MKHPAVAIAYPAVIPKRKHMVELVRALGPKDGPRMLRAVELHEAGNHPDAVRIYKSMIDKAMAKGKQPNVAALYLVAMAAHQVCEHLWACQQMARVVEREPGFLEGWFNLGTMIAHLGDYASAERCHRVALEIAPDFGNARTNLGNALLGLGKVDEALAQFDRVRAHHPTDQEARWNRSHVLLIQGNYADGWAEYESRWWLPGFVAMNGHPDTAPIWQGQPLEGKHLGVHFEQGYGDTMMCLRFAPRLRALGARVTWLLQPELIRLARASLDPADTVRSSKLPPPAVDYWLCAMSLPHRLGITVADLDGEPYLRAA